MECAICHRGIKPGGITIGFDIGDVDKDGRYVPNCINKNLCKECAINMLPFLRPNIATYLKLRRNHNG